MSKHLGWKSRICCLAIASAGCGPGQAVADQVHYTLIVAAGAQSGAFTLGIVNSPIVLTCVQTQVGNVGTGQATVIASLTDNGMIYNGYDTNGLFKDVQSNVNPHIVYCDYNGSVELRALNYHQFVVKNNTPASATIVIMENY